MTYITICGKYHSWIYTISSIPEVTEGTGSRDTGHGMAVVLERGQFRGGQQCPALVSGQYKLFQLVKGIV